MSKLSLRKLNEVIEKSGYKKVFLAKKLGMPPNTFYAKLKGRRHFTNSQVGKIADLTGASIQNLFVENGE